MVYDICRDELTKARDRWQRKHLGGFEQLYPVPIPGQCTWSHSSSSSHSQLDAANFSPAKLAELQGLQECYDKLLQMSQELFQGHLQQQQQPQQHAQRQQQRQQQQQQQQPMKTLRQPIKSPSVKAYYDGVSVSQISSSAQPDQAGPTASHANLTPNHLQSTSGSSSDSSSSSPDTCCSSSKRSVTTQCKVTELPSAAAATAAQHAIHEGPQATTGSNMLGKTTSAVPNEPAIDMPARGVEAALAALSAALSAMDTAPVGSKVQARPASACGSSNRPDNMRPNSSRPYSSRPSSSRCFSSSGSCIGSYVLHPDSSGAQGHGGAMSPYGQGSNNRSKAHPPGYSHQSSIQQHPLGPATASLVRSHHHHQQQYKHPTAEAGVAQHTLQGTAAPAAAVAGVGLAVRPRSAPRPGRPEVASSHTRTRPFSAGLQTSVRSILAANNPSGTQLIRPAQPMLNGNTMLRATDIAAAEGSVTAASTVCTVFDRKNTVDARRGIVAAVQEANSALQAAVAASASTNVTMHATTHPILSAAGTVYSQSTGANNLAAYKQGIWSSHPLKLASSSSIPQIQQLGTLKAKALLQIQPGSVAPQALGFTRDVACMQPHANIQTVQTAPSSVLPSASMPAHGVTSSENLTVVATGAPFIQSSKLLLRGSSTGGLLGRLRLQGP